MASQNELFEFFMSMPEKDKNGFWLYKVNNEEMEISVSYDEMERSFQVLIRREGIEFLRLSKEGVTNIYIKGLAPGARLYCVCDFKGASSQLEIEWYPTVFIHDYTLMD